MKSQIESRLLRTFILIADYFDVTLDCLFGRPSKTLSSPDVLHGIDDAVIKTGVIGKPLNPAVKPLLHEFLARLSTCFMKIVDEHKAMPEGAAPGAGGKKELTREIAERIRGLSESKGIPYTRALDEAGCHIGFVKNMYSQGCMPAADAFIPIADYFGVTLDFLLGRPKVGTNCPKLLAGFEESMSRLGVTDKSIKPEDRALYFEFLKCHAEAFLRLKDGLANNLETSP